MKFSNGCWLQKKDVSFFSCGSIFYETGERSGGTMCTYNKINHRGDTLGGVNLTIKISAPMPEVLRIQTYHYMGVRKNTRL